MPTLIFDPPTSNHELIENGETILPKQEFTVSAERAAQLLSDPGLHVREASDELRKLKLPDLKKLLTELGVENVEQFRSKDAAIAAIENASAGSQTLPEAAGEGHDSNEEA